MYFLISLAPKLLPKWLPFLTKDDANFCFPRHRRQFSWSQLNLLPITNSIITIIPRKSTNINCRASKPMPLSFSNTYTHISHSHSFSLFQYIFNYIYINTTKTVDVYLKVLMHLVVLFEIWRENFENSSKLFYSFRKIESTFVKLLKIS